MTIIDDSSATGGRTTRVTRAISNSSAVRPWTGRVSASGRFRIGLARSTASSVPIAGSVAETLDVLSDPALVSAIAEGEAASAHGDVVSLDEFRRIVGELRR